MGTKNYEFSKTSSSFGGKGWLVILFSFVCILFDSSIINDSLNVTIGAFAEIKEWNISLLYIFSTITAWIAVVGAAMWGIISHKISIRFAWALSLGICSAACFLWGHASSPIVYFICLAAASVGGMGFAYIANLNVISNWFPRKKGLAMGWVTIGFPVSAMISLPLTSNLLAKGGLTTIYNFYGIATLILCIICIVFIRDFPEQAGAFPDNDKSFDKAAADRQLQEGLAYMKTSPWTVKKLFATKTTWLIGFSLGVMELFALGIMTNFVPRFMQAGYQMPQIIGMLTITGAVACVGSYLCGVLDAHVGPKKATIITYFFGIASIILNLIPNPVTVYLSLPFLGVLLGGSANYLVSICNTIWGRYDFPMSYKVIKPIVAALGALGVAVVGVIGHSVSYTAAYIFLACLAAVATIVMFFVDDTLVGKDL
ncbi:MAG TPA: MFS transporter [Clostridiales bacterium]|nr:MFS transporter [Clostridiales bacterium]